MKKIIIAVALLVSSAMQAQTPWDKISLSEHVNISFPSKPMVNKAEGQQSYMLKLADSTANLIVSVSDLKKLLDIDSATLAAAMETDESWEQAKNAIVTNLGSNVTLVKEEMLTFNNKKAMRLIMNKKTDKGDTNVLTVLVFTEGTNSYNVYFNSRAGKGNEKTKDQFFNSIEIH